MRDTVMDLDEYNRFTKGYYEKQGKSELWCKADCLDAEYKATLEHQDEISFQAGLQEVGEALCILIGNTMLKDMEKGKELGEQLRPIIELCKSGKPSSKRGG